VNIQAYRLRVSQKKFYQAYWLILRKKSRSKMMHS
jgi:hypothetical protein